MNRILLTIATASMFVVGCGRAALEGEALSPTPSAPAKAEIAEAAPAAQAKEDVGEEAKPAAAAALRQPGDFVVYRFSGSFRKAPLTLAEKVVARRGALVTIDLSLKDGEGKEELRVTFNEASPSRNEVVSVTRLEGGVEKPATLDAYEALMMRTTLTADQNEALVGTEDVTVDVGGAAVPAKRTTYLVRVGKKAATMKTFESTAFAWGDVGGEITAANGKVLYRAEVIEAGHDGAAKAAASR